MDSFISRGKQMHMVFHAAHEEGRAIELFGDAAEIRVQSVARGFVAQERPSVFGGENQMNVNGGQGLWHVWRMVNRSAARQRESATGSLSEAGLGIRFQSQRDCVHQPKVGATAPTLGQRHSNHQSQRGCGEGGAWKARGRNGRNRVAVGNILRTVTQGSSFLATLGWRTQSRWDWPTPHALPRWLGIVCGQRR